MSRKMILWDFGNVIAPFSVDLFLENLASLFQVTPFEIIYFLEHKGTSKKGALSFWHAVEAGDHWTDYAIYEAFCSHFKQRPFFEMFIDAFNESLYEDVAHGKRFVSLSARMNRVGYYQGLISNADYIHSKKMDNELGHLLAYIPKEFRYYSWRLRCRKNEDPQIFNVVFTALESILKIDRNNIVFIDDRPENIEGARAAGIHAIEFNIGDGLYRLEGKLNTIGFFI